MENTTHDQSDEQRQRFPTEEGNGAGDTEVRVEIMNREKREGALAWAQAYRLIRGGVDEVVEMVEGSQYTIELLLQALRDAACGCGDGDARRADAGCDACRRREALLAQLT